VGISPFLPTFLRVALVSGIGRLATVAALPTIKPLASKPRHASMTSTDNPSVSIVMATY
jgi:hypothetical protein